MNVFFDLLNYPTRYQPKNNFTALLLQQGWVKRYPVHYLAWSKEQAALGVEELGYMDDQYMNVKIDCTNKDELKALAAYKTYVTQYAPAEMEEDHQKIKKGFQ